MWLHPLGERWLEAKRWAEVGGQRFRRREHVNFGEAEALLQMVKLIARRPELHGSRVLDFADSRVVIGAASKGRSSSYRLLLKLRRLCAYTLAAGLDVGYRYVKSKDSPADGASRWRGRGFRILASP